MTNSADTTLMLASPLTTSNAAFIAASLHVKIFCFCFCFWRHAAVPTLWMVLSSKLLVADWGDAGRSLKLLPNNCKCGCSRSLEDLGCVTLRLAIPSGFEYIWPPLAPTCSLPCCIVLTWFGGHWFPCSCLRLAFNLSQPRCSWNESMAP